jgi:hypothetical protein
LVFDGPTDCVSGKSGENQLTKRTEKGAGYIAALTRNPRSCPLHAVLGYYYVETLFTWLSKTAGKANLTYTALSPRPCCAGKDSLAKLTRLLAVVSQLGTGERGRIHGGKGTAKLIKCHMLGAGWAMNRKFFSWTAPTLRQEATALIP